MPLSTKVGLGPGCTVLHGDPDPPSRKGHAPIFDLCLWWPVEPAALHAAAKNIIYFTALAVLRGRPLSA